MDASVVVVQQRIPDEVDVLVVGLAKVTTACAFVLRHALPNRKPSVGSVDVSFVMNHLVHLCGDMLDSFSRKTTYNDIVIVVISNQLSKILVSTSGIASREGVITLHLGIVTHEQDVADVGVAVVLALDVGFNGIAGGACRACADHRRGTANLLFPVDERLHGTHESVVADDEQFAGLVDGRVSVQTLAVIDEVVLVHGTKFSVHLHRVRAAAEGVFALLTVGIHFNGHVVIHAQCVRYRIVGKGIEHHVLPTEVAENVRIVKTHILSGEESIRRIGLTVGVRHIVRVHGARKIAFRGRDFHLEISVLRIDKADAVMLHVADDGRNGNHRQVRFARFSRADGTRSRDDVGLAARCGHLVGMEAGDLQVDGDLVFGRRNQSRLDGARVVALDGDPLLAESHDRKHDEQESNEMFSHNEIN